MIAMSDLERVRESVAAAGGDVAGFEAAARQRMQTQGAFLHFLPFTRRRSISETLGAADAQPFDGVTLRDPLGGGEYDAVLDDRGRPTYFAVRAIDGALTEVEELSRDLVVSLVRQYVAATAAGDVEADVIDRRDALQQRRNGRPTLAHVGRLIRDATAAGVSPRDVVKQNTGVSIATVDRLIREARAADPTLPQARRLGRKPKTEEI